MSKLEVFDFDGTLVFSPLRSTFLNVKGLGKGEAETLYDKWLMQNNKPPKKWKGWFGRKETLLHPIFPRPLREDMLNKPIADLFVKSIANPNVTTWMMTGRHQGLSHHVLEILMGYNLFTKKDLSLKKLNTLFATKKPTLDWKKDTLFEAVAEHNYTEIEIWEDRPEHVIEFNDFAKDLAELGCMMKVNEVYE